MAENAVAAGGFTDAGVHLLPFASVGLVLGVLALVALLR